MARGNILHEAYLWSEVGFLCCFFFAFFKPKFAAIKKLLPLNLPQNDKICRKGHKQHIVILLLFGQKVCPPITHVFFFVRLKKYSLQNLLKKKIKNFAENSHLQQNFMISKQDFDPPRIPMAAEQKYTSTQKLKKERYLYN